jgi:hypothetical protein
MTGLVEPEPEIARVVEFIEAWGVVETAAVWTVVEVVEILGLVELVVEVVEVVVVVIVLVAGVVRARVVVVEGEVEGAAEVVNGSGSEGQYGCNV